MARGKAYLVEGGGEEVAMVSARTYEPTGRDLLICVSPPVAIYGHHVILMCLTEVSGETFRRQSGRNASEVPGRALR